VPDFLPFRGTRYRDASDLSAVVAPPYDVIDEEERAALEATDPHNAVRLILPRPSRSADAYAHAASDLTAWLDEGVLSTDPNPAFYRYEMRFTGAQGDARHTVGVLGALTLPDPAAPDVLAHERTLPKARTDRLSLLRATRANLDPIWCLSLAPGLTDLTPGPAPVATATDATGTTHTLTPVTDPARIDEIHDRVANAPLVIADGHHRFATAATYHEERPSDAGAAGILTFVVELDEQMLDVRSIHRLLHHAPADLRARLAAAGALEPAGPNTDTNVQQLAGSSRPGDDFLLVDRDGCARVLPSEATRRRIDEELPVALQHVDAARFDVALRPLLGDAELSYRDDAVSVANVVAKGAADAAVLLRPVTVPQIRSAAQAGLRMPEKTTFFWPKPRTGMVFRLLDR
jgi:uncharacterized protein (DUF1015 family)